MMKVFSLFLLLSAVLLTASARTINVIGEGSISTSPDLATVDLGVSTSARTAAAALSENNRRSQRISEVLKANGVEGKDIQTSSFDVFQDARGRRENRTRIYTVSNQLSVKIRDVDSLGKILDSVVRAGSNSVNGVTFGLQDSQMAKDKARKIAVKDAARKAKLYADEAGVRVGKVITISETVIAETRRPSQFGVSSLASTAERRPVPVSGGELDIEIELFLLYELLE